MNNFNQETELLYSINLNIDREDYGIITMANNIVCISYILASLTFGYPRFKEINVTINP